MGADFVESRVPKCEGPGVPVFVEDGAPIVAVGADFFESQVPESGPGAPTGSLGFRRMRSTMASMV